MIFAFYNWFETKCMIIKKYLLLQHFQQTFKPYVELFLEKFDVLISHTFVEDNTT